MLRRLFMWVFAFVAAASAVAWAASFWRSVGFIRSSDVASMQTGCRAGQYYFAWAGWANPSGTSTASYSIEVSPDLSTVRSPWGFYWEARDDESLQGFRTYYFAVPCWTGVAFPGTAAAWLWRRGRRPRPEGTCRHCGYDLRATPDRCPECGEAAEGAAATETPS